MLAVKFAKKRKKEFSDSKIPKIYLVLAGIFFLVVALSLFAYPKINMFLIKEIEEEIPVPAILDGQEIVERGYKYSNNSGIILSAPSYISCSWKPASRDDGWKSCEAIFEIEDKRLVKQILSTPNINLEFRDMENIKNIEISYSNDFEVVEKEAFIYNEPDSWKILNEQKKEGFISQSLENSSQKEELNAGKIDMDPRAILEKLNFGKREFKNFLEIDYNSNLALNPTWSDSNLTLNASEPDINENFNLSLENETIEPLEDNLSQENNSPQSITELTVSPFSSDNEDSEQNVSNMEIPANDSAQNFFNETAANMPVAGVSEDNLNPILGAFLYNFVTSLKGYSLVLGWSLLDIPSSKVKLGKSSVPIPLKSQELLLDTSRPLAIKISFEVPKYSSNHFNFKISDENFSAFIDPEISACGTLNSENSIYYLARNIESTGICFTITANNITLDCQGNRIRYSNTGDDAYAIYSLANDTIIQNCTISEGDINENLGIGIYLKENYNGSIINNTFLLADSFDFALYLDSGANHYIANNNFSTSSEFTYQIYSDGTKYSTIKNNRFNNPNWGSCGIFFGSGSSFNNITNNHFRAVQDAGYSTYINSSESNNIDFNDFFMSGSDMYGLFINSGTNLNVSYNNFTSYASDSYSLYLSSVLESEIDQNSFFIDSDDSYGAYLLSSHNNSINHNSFATFGTGIYSSFLSSSNSNVVYGNTFETHGSEGYALYLSNSDSCILQSNNLTLLATSSYSFYLDSSSFSRSLSNNYSSFFEGSSHIYIGPSSNSNIFFRDIINSFGNYSSCFYFDRDTNLNNISLSLCNSSGIDSYSIYVSESNNNFSIENSIINSEESYELVVEEGIHSGLFEFTNTTLENFNFRSANASLLFYFYLDVLTQYSNSTPLSEVNVTIYNSSNIVYSGLTNSQGRIGPLKLLGYSQNSSQYFEYYLYNISVFYQNESTQIVNLSANNLTIFNFVANSTDLNNPAPPSGGGSPSGSGGFAISDCSAQWICKEWSDCIDEKQARLCTNPYPECNKNKPDMERSCKTLGVESDKKAALFDITLRILKKNILKSEKLSGAVGLINLGVPGKVKANLFYQVKNESGESVYEEKEIVTVETQIEFIKTINTLGFKEGNYELLVDLSYEGQKEPARAVDSFVIREGILFQIMNGQFIFVLTSFILIFAFLFIVFWVHHKITKLEE